MKKLNQVAALLASLAFTGIAGAQTIDNWRSGDNQLVWKNGTNEHCWRDANWTPATAAPGCDGAIVRTIPPEQVVVPPAPQPTPTPPVVVNPPVVPLVVTATKFTFSADTFFDFDKSVLKRDGKAQLDELVANARNMNLEVVIAVGHTDSVGTDAYNQRLSVRRAQAVKAYLVSAGIEKSRVFTEGKSESHPVADNRTRDGRAQNRRVEIEMVGTRIR